MSTFDSPGHGVSSSHGLFGCRHWRWPVGRDDAQPDVEREVARLRQRERLDRRRGGRARRLRRGPCAFLPFLPSTRFGRRRGGFGTAAAQCGAPPAHTTSPSFVRPHTPSPAAAISVMRVSAAVLRRAVAAPQVDVAVLAQRAVLGERTTRPTAFARRRHAMLAPPPRAGGAAARRCRPSTRTRRSPSSRTSRADREHVLRVVDARRRRSGSASVVRLAEADVAPARRPSRRRAARTRVPSPSTTSMHAARASARPASRRVAGRAVAELALRVRAPAPHRRVGHHRAARVHADDDLGRHAASRAPARRSARRRHRRRFAAAASCVGAAARSTVDVAARDERAATSQAYFTTDLLPAADRSARAACCTRSAMSSNSVSCDASAELVREVHHAHEVREQIAFLVLEPVLLDELEEPQRRCPRAAPTRSSASCRRAARGAGPCRRTPGGSARPS